MKSNKPHILTPTKTKPLPTNLIFLDTETDVRPITDTRKVHKLKLGIAWYCQRSGEHDLQIISESVFSAEDQLYSWLKRLLVGNQTFYMIAHNIAYDAMIVHAFRELPKLGFELGSLYSKGQVTIIRWTKGKTKLIMLDNGNFFDGKLERWGETFNIPKLGIDFETCNLEELTIYCRRDVEIMFTSWRVWFRFLVENDCGGFRVTVGSTAFNTWRHKYMPEGVYVHKHKHALKLERDSYHGGRTECFYQGTLREGPYYYVDINNMYGYVMREGIYPVGLQGYSKRLSIRRLISYLERYCVIARVLVNVDAPAFVTKVNGFTAYPLGRFDTTLTTNELLVALQMGWLEELYEFSWYRAAPLYESYVNHFYDLRMNYREQGNTGFEKISKLFINSLYGKFGQTGLRQEIIGHCAPDEIWSMSVHNISNGVNSRQVAIGGIIYEEFKDGESFHAMPAVAAHVTANARLYLYSIITRAGWENSFYCDTDSVIVNQAGHRRLLPLLSQNEIGKLKIELVSDFVTLYAAKEYKMRGRSRVKGVRSNASELWSGTYLHEQWPKLAGQIRAGMPDDYVTELKVKRQTRRITSGTVGVTGRVEPFELE